MSDTHRPPPEKPMTKASRKAHTRVKKDKAREARRAARRLVRFPEKPKLEDEYWTQSALDAEAAATSRNETPIPFEDVERELDALKKSRSAGSRKIR